MRTVPGAGHMIHYLATDEVLAAIDWAAEQSNTVEPVGSELADATVPSSG